jgi:hypothetical protein
LIGCTRKRFLLGWLEGKEYGNAVLDSIANKTARREKLDVV